MHCHADAEHDMFWPQQFDKAAAFKACQDNWGVIPRPMWPTIQYASTLYTL